MRAPRRRLADARDRRPPGRRGVSMNRRSFLRVVLGTTSLLVTAACSQLSPTAPAAAPKPVAAVPASANKTSAVAISFSDRTTSDLALFLAKEQGLFDAQGVNADLQFIASNTGVPALLSDQTQ